MPTSDDIPVFGATDELDMPDRTPIPFKVVGYNVEREPQTFTFHAAATPSLGLMFDIAGATDSKGNVHPSVITKFFQAIIVKEDLEEWDRVMHDTDLFFIDTALQEIAEYLSGLYASDETTTRPTKPRSASAAGRGTAGQK